MKKLSEFNKVNFLLVILSLVVWTSCKVEKVKPANEAVKDIAGSWKVIKATRNGFDLYPVVDFSQFRINFQTGNTYTLVNKLPFLVSNDGTYSLDDPQYPFKIAFTATAGGAAASPVSTGFTYPIVNGVRQISLTFNTGCNINSYTYILQKAN